MIPQPSQIEKWRSKWVAQQEAKTKIKQERQLANKNTFRLRTKEITSANDERLWFLCKHAKDCKKLNDKKKPKTFCLLCTTFDRTCNRLFPNSRFNN